MKGRLIWVSWVVESSIFAFSAASYSRWSEFLSAERSIPWSRLNSATIHSTIALSQLSPPRWLSPAVALTSKTPVADLEHRDVEGAAAEVEDQDRLVGPSLSRP